MYVYTPKAADYMFKCKVSAVLCYVRPFFYAEARIFEAKAIFKCLTIYLRKTFEGKKGKNRIL